MLLKPTFWKNVVIGNTVILVISILLNLFVNPSPWVNHQHPIYWYMVGCTFAFIVSLFFWGLLLLFRNE